jgi:hypothetical protein
MSTSEEVRRLESQLEMDKQHLHEDASLISNKIDQTKAELSPANLIRKKPYIVLGIALSAGFAFGYFLDWRFSAKEIAGPVLEHIGKPAAHTAASSAGKQLATEAIRNQYHGHA